MIAISVSDLHLSHRPPVFRSAEKDWYGVMERYLNQMFDLMDAHDCPALWAGDVFNHWNEPAELVNFVIRKIKDRKSLNTKYIVAVAGQHDCPYHRVEDLNRTALGTLEEAEAVYVMPYGEPLAIDDHAVVWGFSWKEEFKPCVKEKGIKDIALIHRYVWKHGHSFPGADDAGHVEIIRDQLRGFDVIVSGDNHKGFIDNGKQVICNTGGFIRRKSDEVDYKPMIGLIHESGTVTPHYLDCTEDVFLNPSELASIVKDGIDVSAFLAELNQLGDKAISFREAVEDCIRSQKVREEVATIILKAMEKQ